MHSSGRLALVSVIYIIDDDGSFHTAIRKSLRKAEYDVQILSSVELFLLPQADQSNRLGCLVVDVDTPKLDGPEFLARLLAAGSTLPVVFVSAHEDVETVVKTIKAGAEDFLLKPVPSSVLLAAIERAIARHAVSRRLANELEIMRACVARLTARERQVFDRILRGTINKQIGFDLGATERTIKAHRQKIMEKMGARSVAELVLTANRLGLLPV